MDRGNDHRQQGQHEGQHDVLRSRDEQFQPEREGEAERDPARLLVVFLKDAPGAAHVKALAEAIAGPEVVRARGRHAYIFYPAGIGRSSLTHALIEKRLGTHGTGRNWNTVLKLAALAQD